MTGVRKISRPRNYLTRETYPSACLGRNLSSFHGCQTLSKLSGCPDKPPVALILSRGIEYAPYGVPRFLLWRGLRLRILTHLPSKQACLTDSSLNAVALAYVVHQKGLSTLNSSSVVMLLCHVLAIPVHRLSQAVERVQTSVASPSFLDYSMGNESCNRGTVTRRRSRLLSVKQLLLIA